MPNDFHDPNAPQRPSAVRESPTTFISLNRPPPGRPRDGIPTRSIDAVEENEQRGLRCKRADTTLKRPFIRS